MVWDCTCLWRRLTNHMAPVLCVLLCVRYSATNKKIVLSVHMCTLMFIHLHPATTPTPTMTHTHSCTQTNTWGRFPDNHRTVNKIQTGRLADLQLRSFICPQPESDAHKSRLLAGPEVYFVPVKYLGEKYRVACRSGWMGEVIAGKPQLG